jgi:hypothetical protein
LVKNFSTEPTKKKSFEKALWQVRKSGFMGMTLRWKTVLMKDNENFPRPKNNTPSSLEI